MLDKEVKRYVDIDVGDPGCKNKSVSVLMGLNVDQNSVFYINRKLY